LKYEGGLSFIPSGTKEVNSYMNFFETVKEDKPMLLDMAPGENNDI
jgi:hypothetical protein